MPSKIFNKKEMQIIQNIRDKGTAIVIAVIALALIGFLLMDAQGSKNRSAGGNTSIGKVNGESIDGKEYDSKVQEYEAQQAAQMGGSLSPAQSNQLRNQVWDQLVAEKLLMAELNKLGIEFTPAELTSIIYSDDAPQALKQAFTDPNTGVYDVSKVQEWWKNAKKLKTSVEKERKEKESIDQQVIEPARLNSLYTKYNSMFNAAAYYPSWMKQKDAADGANFATVSYTSIPFTVISDTSVKVTDSDIDEYVKKHKALYTQEAGRMISYYSYSSAPNAADTIANKAVLENLKPAFASDSNEKVFLAKTGSTMPLNEDFVYKNKMQGAYKDTIAKLPKGGLFGPYIEGKNFVVAKKIDEKQLPDSARVRHILIKIADLKNGQISNQIRPDSVARKLVDSIANAIKNGADFNELVLKYSDDPGSKDKKGEYSFTSNNSLVDSFYRTTFYEPVGTKKVVLGVDANSYAGYHYIEVLNQFKFGPAYKVAYLSKEITASDETTTKATQDAVKLSGSFRNAKDLDVYAAKNGIKKISYPTPVKESDFSLGALEDAKKIIKWSYDAKEGDVSDPFTVGDQNVVAVLDKVIKEGLPDAKTARPLVEMQIRQEKIAEQIIKKLGVNPTPETAATAYPNLFVQTAGADSSLTFSSPMVPNIGSEPKFIGACFNKENLNKPSKPIIGQRSIFVLRVNSVAAKTPKTADAVAAEVKQHEQQLQQQYRSWFDAMKKLATIKDDRNKNY